VEAFLAFVIHGRSGSEADAQTRSCSATCGRRNGAECGDGSMKMASACSWAAVFYVGVTALILGSPRRRFATATP